MNEEDHEVLQRIPETFSANGHQYVLVERQSNVAIYKIIEPSAGYEVHLIRLQKSSVKKINGKIVHFKHKELLASNEDFGIYGWHYPSLEQARAKRDLLLE